MQTLKSWLGGHDQHYHQKDVVYPTAYQPLTSTYGTEKGSEFGQQQYGYSKPLGTSTSFVQELPKEFKECSPVITEKVKREEVEEIQPIIHREHEKLEVRRILQEKREKLIQPTQIQQVELPVEYLPTVSKGEYVPEVFVPSPNTQETFRCRVEKAPIIQDYEKKKILEEIQPVIIREIVQPVIIRQTKNIYEKIIEPPLVYKEMKQGFERPLETPKFQQTFQQPMMTQEFGKGEHWIGPGAAPLPSNLEKGTTGGTTGQSMTTGMQTTTGTTSVATPIGTASSVQPSEKYGQPLFAEKNIGKTLIGETVEIRQIHREVPVK